MEKEVLQMLTIKGDFEREADGLCGPLCSVVACSRYADVHRVCSAGEDEQERDVWQRYLGTGGNGAQGNELVA